MSLAGAALTGAWAALRTPLWLRGRRWTTLLAPPAQSASGAVAARGAVRAARAGVRALAAVPGSPWRNTCLYRSVAECLALRRYGVPAVVRIGVRSGDDPARPIVAHAWVVADPAAEAPPPDRLQPFALRAGSSAPCCTTAGSDWRRTRACSRRSPAGFPCSPTTPTPTRTAPCCACFPWWAARPKPSPPRGGR